MWSNYIFVHFLRKLYVKVKLTDALAIACSLKCLKCDVDKTVDVKKDLHIHWEER